MLLPIAAPERNQYIQQSLTVKMASGVEAGFGFLWR